LQISHQKARKQGLSDVRDAWEEPTHLWRLCRRVTRVPPGSQEEEAIPELHVCSGYTAPPVALMV